MLTFDKTKVAKEEFYGSKKTIKSSDVNADNIVISKLIERKNNSKYLIRHLDYRTKIRTYGDKVYTNFCCLNLPEDGVECEYFTVVSSNSLVLYENKYELQVYLDNGAYKKLDKQMVDYFDDNLFKSDYFCFILLKLSYKCFITIELI